MALSPEEKEIFFDLLRGLTPGHASTVIASLSEPESRIGTSTDSANYAFLQQLCEWGLAKELPLEVELPPEIQSALTSFSINEDAKAEIAQLLKQASRETRE
jgi:hypothetical protein